MAEVRFQSLGWTQETSGRPYWSFDSWKKYTDVTTHIAKLGRRRQWSLALNAFQSLQDCGFRGAVAANAASSACEKGEQWQHVLGLVAHLQRTRVENAVITCNTAVSACWTVDGIR